MAYLGRGLDKISNVEVLDNITFDGSSSYTLQKNSVNFIPSSANTLLLSIDGIVQAGNFTVSGSTIDFGTAVAGTSTCNFVLHYGVGLITAPSDGTVTTAKLADDAVTAAKINNDIISGSTELASEPADTDEFLVSDAGTLKRIDYSLIKGGGASDAFHAYDMSSNTSGDLVFSTELYDDGGNYNTSNGRYTAPSDGTYLFSSGAMSTGTAAKIIFKKNGSDFAGGGDMFGYSPNASTQGVAHLIVDLSASDYINVNANNAVYGNYVFFNGVKLY